MNIQLNNYQMFFTPNINLPKYGFVRNYSTSQLNNDRFEMSDKVSFTGKKENKKVVKKIEQTLKSLDGLHDPYSDVIMISAPKFKNFQMRNKKRGTAESSLALLSNYTKHMFEPETKIYEMLKKETAMAKRNGTSANLTFTDILQKHLPMAKLRLVSAQLDVVDNIREFSQHNLNKEDKEYVDLYLKIIEKDIYNDRFRIKPSKDLLKRLDVELSDKQAAKQILKIAKQFPNTSTNSDAFIVKNYNKSHEEISELLISPAQISIEHIKPSSEHGESKATNYLAASKRMNNYRSSLPLDELIEEYPDIPRQTQVYFDDLIRRINRGGISDLAPSLEGVKESLYKESKGQIDVDLSELRPEIVNQTEMIKNKIGELIDHFKN